MKKQKVARRRDVVTIYEDPVTRLKPEGKAELVKFIGFDEYPAVERHLVHFLGDPPGQFVERVIVVNVDAGRG